MSAPAVNPVGSALDAGLVVGVIQSPALVRVGVPHGFSTRAGGVSAGMFASLNFGNPGELGPAERDSPANLAENWRRLTHAIGAAGRRVLQVHQVHGAEVAVASPDAPWADALRADAIVTDDAGALAAVRVADCAPVLISTLDGRVVAAVHAGWRGVVGGVALATARSVREVARRIGASAELAAAVGPCIAVGAFEVGEEVAAQFEARFGDEPGVVRRAGVGGGGFKPHVDLSLALARQLRAEGVPGARLDVLAACTASDPTRYFSHRRDRGLTGRMVGVIGPVLRSG